MDLLFTRYASPFLLLDQLILTNSLSGYIDDLFTIISEEKQEQTMWEFFLHKVYDKTWKEFCENHDTKKGERYMDDCCNLEVAIGGYKRDALKDRNLLPSKQAVEAHLALMHLHQLRDCYRQGWEPNWSDGEDKYCIVRSYNDTNHLVVAYKGAKVFLSFQSADIARLFLKNFRGLIEAAGDLV